MTYARNQRLWVARLGVCTTHWLSSSPLHPKGCLPRELGFGILSRRALAFGVGALSRPYRALPFPSPLALEVSHSHLHSPSSSPSPSPISTRRELWFGALSRRYRAPPLSVELALVPVVEISHPPLAVEACCFQVSSKVRRFDISLSPLDTSSSSRSKNLESYILASSPGHELFVYI
jgi:hypothetical protein